LLGDSEGLSESNNKLIREVLCEIETWMNGAGGVALEYAAQLALCYTEGNPFFDKSAVAGKAEVYLLCKRPCHNFIEFDAIN
jgi:hypothetical protein